MKLKNETITGIRQSIEMRTELMTLFKCSEYTLLKMLRENDARLTQASALRIMENHLSISTNLLMVEE